MISPLITTLTGKPSSRNLLFICPNFFSFPLNISQTLCQKGFNVFYFDDRPSKSSIIKALIRINRKTVRLMTDRYLSKIINFGQKKSIDFVFLVNGQAFLEKDIRKLRVAFPKARFVFSSLDSVHNYPELLKLASLFDKAYSFDDEDVLRYKIFSLLPDFYTNEYLFLKKVPPRFDFFYFGTAHPKKLRETESMIKQLQNNGYLGFAYHYLPSKLVFFYNKIRSKSYKKKKISDFHFSPLSTKEICQYFEESRIIIDSPAAGQSGLTPRCICAVGAKKKLITTNPNIKNYDFYKPENVYLAINGVIDFSDIFFHSDYAPSSENVYKKYSLSNWCDQIIGN